MKKSKILILSLVAFVTLAFSFKTIAQKQKNKKRDEIRKEVSAYTKANILPVVLEQRKAFDKDLSSDEKATLVSLRERLDALKAKRDTMKRPEGEPTEEQKKAHKEMEKEMRLIMTDAWVIADNHEDDLEKINASNKEQKEQWKNDIKAIFVKYKGDNSNKGENGKHKKKGKMMHGKMMFDHNKPAMFVLMDPNKTVDELASDMEQRMKKRGRHGKGRHHGGGNRN